AHARPGLHKVYDLHAYEKEKADAIKLWHANLRNIIEVKLPDISWMRIPAKSPTDSGINPPGDSGDNSPTCSGVNPPGARGLAGDGI
ncbi:MAG: hypothetical protein WBS14_18280, partial [Rhodomicrobium sp.]